MSTSSLTDPRPILRCTERVGEALNDAAGMEPVYLTAGEKGAALVQLEREMARLRSLQLRILAVAATWRKRQAPGRLRRGWMAGCGWGTPPRVVQAEHFDPRQLRLVGRKVLEVVAPDVADARNTGCCWPRRDEHVVRPD